MPKKKEAELTPEEQFKRFQKAAKESGVEGRLPEIEQDFEKLASHPRQSKNNKRK
jgi:hypothetical protein